MDQREVIEILVSLANGTDPITGTATPSGCGCQQPVAIRALFNAIRLLQQGHATDSQIDNDTSLESHSETKPADIQKREIIRHILGGILCNAALREPQAVTPPARQQQGISPRSVSPAQLTSLAGHQARAKFAASRSATEKCPDKCGNCEMPLRSWGEYIDAHKCVYCENSGRVW